MINRKAPESVMRDLCEAVDRWTGSYSVGNGPQGGRLYTALVDSLSAYRAATAPLRTRASVDAEIGLIVRTIAPSHWRELREYTLGRLCSEPATDEPEPNAATDHDADMRPCGCEETEALKKRLRDINNTLSVCASIDAKRQLELYWLSKL